MKKEVFEVIQKNAHAVAINMNDVFYYACADVSCIDIDDLRALEPVIEQYGYEAFIAYEALKRGHDPQVASSRTTNFKYAKLYIKKLMDEAEEYGDFYELKEIIEASNDSPDQSMSSIKSSRSLAKIKSKIRDSWFSFFR